ncbi:Asp23/Gls24 family envelope stress response protein [Clostridium chromiireducens]|uniref:Alkaline shock protein 23 n=1 Tax=Clostridium chromiireducens TaxID=225345 RepID=A0A1V4IRM6_9CLOT|nr:Asp23/Gls24 family envelope stress response protein [Clostridium chromiireducens]MVX64861.1 Asp23/Gls24 family envelope stress response protein [Clostridium chromiireducens]OPJ62672.1 alkaline shock protein 23 [Clostridium chromiireducens]RII33294.1 Asp23/Gls24 family envelope stress response protein [Clostridium chromiireducens]
MEDLIREDNIGVVKISDEVVSVIAGIAAQEIDGILDGQMGVASNLTNIFKGKKSTAKASKVTLEEDRAIIDMNVSVEYGKKIMDVVAQVQDNVKKTVEAMTGLYVEAVNIYVQNVYLPKKEESESI